MSNQDITKLHIQNLSIILHREKTLYLNDSFTNIQQQIRNDSCKYILYLQEQYLNIENDIYKNNLQKEEEKKIIDDMLNLHIKHSKKLMDFIGNIFANYYENT